jgi:glyoxylase-like metal-dependent hydrolase (beta-lactamase superfamily II)
LDKAIKLETLSVGPLAANCYLIINKTDKKCVLIDPGDEPAEILKRIQSSGAKLEGIFLTHGHIDHIGALAHLSAPTFIHKDDLAFLGNNQLNLSNFLNLPFKLEKNNSDINSLEDDQVVEVAGLVFKIIHTPGHTPGSISIKFENILFTGDTLFCGSIGRTDLVYGSDTALLQSIKNKLLCFPGDTKIYPGHGPSSTLKEEKENNPYL